VPVRLHRKDVFINCPFDETYKPIFDAIIFTVLDLGFVARCALEVDDASEGRLAKIVRIIEQCTYGIHDISSVGLGTTNLPRFNMPLELGLYLGCKLFGGNAQQNKGCLILDGEPYRYRTSISDISGQDIHAHHGEPDRAITEVRNWLVNVSKTKSSPGGARIAERYARFVKDLPSLCESMGREHTQLTFTDYSEAVGTWLKLPR
jgi:hypothetical protein